MELGIVTIKSFKPPQPMLKGPYILQSIGIFVKRSLKYRCISLILLRYRHICSICYIFSVRYDIMLSMTACVFAGDRGFVRAVSRQFNKEHGQKVTLLNKFCTFRTGTYEHSFLDYFFVW